MTGVVVPVRYPLTDHSESTLRRAIEVVREHDATLTVLHVNLYQNGKRVTRTDLKRAVEDRIGRLDDARYVVREGFLVEESILEEVAAEGAEFVVIGHKQASRWRRMVRSIVADPDIETFLRERLDAKVITVEQE